MSLEDVFAKTRETVGDISQKVQQTSQKATNVIQTVDTARQWYLESGAAMEDTTALGRIAASALRRKGRRQSLTS